MTTPRKRGQPRKPPGVKRERFDFKFSPDVASWLRQQENMTALVESAIREKYLK